MDQQKGSTDEIDLGQLLKRIADAFGTAWLGLMRFLATLRRIPLENKASFLGITAVSVLVSVGYNYLLKKKYYESTMILRSEYLNKRLVDNTIEKLDLLADEEEKDGLARLFNIPDTLAENIIGFESRLFVSEDDVIETELLKEQLRNARANETNETVIDQVIRRIEIENRRTFEITIRTLSPTVMVNLQDALVGYFRNNDYVKRRIDITRATLLARRKKLAGDLEKMDSLKSVIYDNYKSMADQVRSGSNNVILSEKAVTSPVEIYEQDKLIYDDLQKVDRELYLQPDFEVIDSFTQFNEPSSPSMVTMVLFALVVGIGAAYADVAVRKFNTYLANLE